MFVRTHARTHARTRAITKKTQLPAPFGPAYDYKTKKDTKIRLYDKNSDLYSFIYRFRFLYLVYVSRISRYFIPVKQRFAG